MLALFLRPCQENALNLKFILFAWSADIVPERERQMEKFRICHFNAIVSCEVVPGKTPISTDIVYLLPRRRDEESREESLLHSLLPPHPGSRLTNSSSETFPEII